MMRSRCARCGAKAPRKAKFCPECGMSIRASDRSTGQSAHDGSENKGGTPTNLLEQKDSSRPEVKKALLAASGLVSAALIAILVYAFGLPGAGLSMSRLSPIFSFYNEDILTARFSGSVVSSGYGYEINGGFGSVDYLGKRVTIQGECCEIDGYYTFYIGEQGEVLGAAFTFPEHNNGGTDPDVVNWLDDNLGVSHTESDETGTYIWNDTSIGLGVSYRAPNRIDFEQEP